MMKLSPDKILSKRTFVLAALLPGRAQIKFFNMICLFHISFEIYNDKIINRQNLVQGTFVLAALLSQRLAARDKKSSTFYLWRAPTSAYFTLYLLAYVAARKKNCSELKLMIRS